MCIMCDKKGNDDKKRRRINTDNGFEEWVSDMIST